MTLEGSMAGVLCVSKYRSATEADRNAAMLKIVPLRSYGSCPLAHNTQKSRCNRDKSRVSRLAY